MVKTVHDGTPTRILVVEDGLIMARDIERRLHAMGYAVAGLAASGDEAVRMVMHVRPDLVLMDVNLRGGMDGIQTTEKVHALIDVPVVYVTAYSDEATLKRARATDPFGYVLKPFEEKELRTTIEMALYRHGMDRRLRESEQRYRTLSELTSAFAYSMSIAANGELKVEWVTEAFGRLTGSPAEALVSYAGYVHPDDIGILVERDRMLMDGRNAVVEYRLRLRDGSYRWIRDHAHPAPRKHPGEVIHVTGSVQDISHHKDAEIVARERDRLRTSQRSAVGDHVIAAGKRMLLLLESRSSGGAGRSEAGSDLAERLKDLARIHELVYREKHDDPFPLAKALKSIVSEAFKSGGASSRMTFGIEGADVHGEPGLLADLLLVVQDLVMLSLRSAPAQRKGQLQVSVRQEVDGGVVLEYRDDDAALGKEIDLRRPRQPAIRFLADVASRHGGRMDLERETGTVLRLKLPKSSKAG